MCQICPVNLNIINKQIKKNSRTITSKRYFSESAENATRIEVQSPLLQQRQTLELWAKPYIISHYYNLKISQGINSYYLCILAQFFFLNGENDAQDDTNCWWRMLDDIRQLRRMFTIQQWSLHSKKEFFLC